MYSFRSPIFLFSLGAALFLQSCSPGEADMPELSAGIEPGDIESHIVFLAGDELRGRETGSAGEARAANYIADHFEKFGLRPAGSYDTWFQEFTVNMSVVANPHLPGSARPQDRQRLTRNVVGVIEGSVSPDRYIVVGAHFDHLGMGHFGSLYDGATPIIHNGADDNASGTAGLLELAQYFALNRPASSILFVAFSGEEMGLLGSQHFVENAPVPLEEIVAMINMDMIGRLQNRQLLIYGTGTSAGWEEIIQTANTDSLIIESSPGGTGASDHTPFYNRQIPVLHYFTNTHGDYHRPSDDPETINYEGEESVLEHVRRVIERIDTLEADRLAYTAAPAGPEQNSVTIQGVTLGVTPDYGFSGPGLRITGTRPGGPADRAGLQPGDIIIRLAAENLDDIYAYMEVLNRLEEGQATTVTVQRDGEEITFELDL